MDGKQARRTKAASPLGLLFDHGIDLWAIPFMNGMNLLTGIGLGSTIFTALTVLYAFAMIYFLNVEQFYTRVLRLGTFDANADGIHGNTICFIISAIWGMMALDRRDCLLEHEAVRPPSIQHHLYHGLGLAHDLCLCGQVSSRWQ
jgi:hypothetical protein